jgi:hypothetical protein
MGMERREENVAVERGSNGRCVALAIARMCFVSIKWFPGG